MTGNTTEIGSEAEKTATDLAATATEAVKTAAEGAKSFLERAQEVIGEAVETTVEAIKENPVTAAAIAGGVAATVAGAAYGVSKLLEDDKPTKK